MSLRLILFHFVASPAADIFLGSGIVFGNDILANPALFNQPRFSLEIIETVTGPNTEECEPLQSTGGLTLGSGGSTNDIVITTVSDEQVEDCIVNGEPALNCRVFTYEVDQNNDGGSLGPALTALSFELPTCISPDNFLDFVSVVVDSNVIPASALSVSMVTKVGSFNVVSEIFVITIDLDGVVSLGQDFIIEFIYDASFFLPPGFPLLDVVNPFDFLVQVSSETQNVIGAICGPAFCSPQPPPPPSPLASPPRRRPPPRT